MMGIPSSPISPSTITETVFDLPAPVIARIARWRETIMLASSFTSTSGLLRSVPIRIEPVEKSCLKVSVSALSIFVPGGGGTLGILRSFTSPRSRTRPRTYCPPLPSNLSMRSTTSGSIMSPEIAGLPRTRLSTIPSTLVSSNSSVTYSPVTGISLEMNDASPGVASPMQTPITLPPVISKPPGPSLQQFPAPQLNASFPYLL
ncbi:hypothetical protein BMS3Abin16_01060 [archaeon BMS3Abin16]|nr:hypothetical protein BMS3Abin16_01060 [archaeon BMS3Abin16]